MTSLELRNEQEKPFYLVSRVYSGRPVSFYCFLACILPGFPLQLIHLFIHNDDLLSSPFLFLLFVFGILLVAS